NKTSRTKLTGLIVPSISRSTTSAAMRRIGDSVDRSDRGLRRVSCTLRRFVIGDGFCDGVAGVMSDPAFWIIEKPDHGEVSFRTAIEPVLGTLGHGEKIVGGADDLIDLVVHVQIEGTAPFDEETNLVLVVRVFAQELLTKRRPIGIAGTDMDDIGIGIA